ncbi:MAG TPA: hypothetical protein VJQ46_11950, partial [Gemmatimonadales bacterium]|nr:hypothetical protein [Gemmatimonadales bacterium]
MLAALAVLGSACFGGSRNEIVAPMPTPLQAAASGTAVGAVRDTAPAPTAKGSATPKAAVGPKTTVVPRTTAPAAKSAPKAPTGKAPAGKVPAPKPAAKAPSGGTVVKVPAEPSAPSKAVHPASPAKVDSTALEFAVTARLAHEPLSRAIARRTRNPELAERAAWAVTREAGRLRMSPSLLAAVLLVENRQLDSAAVSSQGA